MNNDQTKERAFSPSRTVWRTQMQKGVYTPHRVSRITCIVNQLISGKVSEILGKLGIIVFIESGRTVREYVKQRPFGLPGDIVQLQNSPVNIFRFTVPRETAKDIMYGIVHAAELHIPGRGTIFSQDMMEFCKEPPSIDVDALSGISKEIRDAVFLHKLSYIVCVLSIPGSSEQLAKIALNLGICVPLITFGSGNDIRDQLGLIRIAISAEKEIVHLVTPEHDSESIIRLLIEQAKLDRPGRGFIYQTPVSLGLIDTRLKLGKQKYAATFEQIVAAIDQIKSGTSWRRRLDSDNPEAIRSKSLLPQDNCEISIISDEDRTVLLREACMKVGATGAITSRISPLISEKDNDEGIASTLSRSAVSVPAGITNGVVDILLETSTIREEEIDHIQVLDSPAAYVHSL
jgi:nitrogen regulatory protein PII